MDFVIVFAKLFPGENVSPVVTDVGVTYAKIAETWRGSGPIPTEAELAVEWAVILLEHPEYAMSEVDRLAYESKTMAKSLVELDQTPLGKALRAVVVDVLRKEINRLRERFRNQDAAIATAGTLQQLKTAWANIAAAAPLPEVSKQDVIAVFKNAIDTNA